MKYVDINCNCKIYPLENKYFILKWFYYYLFTIVKLFKLRRTEYKWSLILVLTYKYLNNIASSYLKK